MTGRNVGTRALFLLGLSFACCTLLFAFTTGDKMGHNDYPNPPADLIHWLRGILDDQVAAWTIINRQYFWFDKGLVIAVTDGEGQNVMLLTDGTNVYRINCTSGLPHINKILENLPFPEENFENQTEVRILLGDIVDLFHGPGGIIATRGYLKGIETIPSGLDVWLNKTNTDPNEFRAVWVDPAVTLMGEEWTATFNYLKRDGSVDKWLVLGQFDQANQRVQIDSVDVTALKQKGFFFYCIVP